MVSKKTISIFAPAFGVRPFSRGFFSRFFREAFFSLLTYTLQTRQASTSAWRPSRVLVFLDLFPAFMAFKRRYPFNLLGLSLPGHTRSRVQGQAASIRDMRNRVPGALVPAGSTALGSRWLFFLEESRFFDTVCHSSHPGAPSRRPLGSGGIQRIFKQTTLQRRV